MEVEQGMLKDYEEVLRIWEGSVRSTHHFISEEYIQELKGIISNQALPAVDLYVVKNSEGIIQGFMGTAGDILEMLFVSPTCFRKGIGKALVSYAVKNCDVKRVDVNEQNDGAYHFYVAQGFKMIRRSELDGLGRPYPILHMGLDKRCVEYI
ncbi:GNAT family N-acetyltransferase [Halodesulfovibrio sp.]|uniref:GNAT family N-acetyltransferase n=1 Tax=Halodesulfovibrio sp. TaxID=1912772 RepID=UPI0025BCFB5E|nr:GNAT family N-acetyltransferase [Halodesulfovibrio sp.]